jgi:hypothetical protein
VISSPGEPPFRWTLMDTTRGQTARHGVPFGDQLLDPEAQVREGCAQHVAQPTNQPGAVMLFGRTSWLIKSGPKA